MGDQQQKRAYPKHWEADVVLRDGATAHLRPVHIDDAQLMQQMHSAQSDSSIYLRYFTYKSTLTPKELDRFTQVDYVDRVSFVVLLGSAAEDQTMIGFGGFDRLEGTTEAEVAFHIADSHQGRGVGSILLEHLAAAGRERGIEKFSAEVLPENRKMLTVFAEAGFEVQRAFEDGVVTLSFSIDPTERSREVMESREHRAEARSVAELLSPEQVAVIGASRDYGSVGYHLLQNIVESGFTGGVHSVNPEALEVGGGPAYSSLSHIRAQIDLAVIAVPPEELRQVVIDCGRHGVKGLLVITDLEQQKSDNDAEQAPMTQRELVQLARQWGMRVIGPASVGVLTTNPHISLNASLSPRMPLRGGVGLFSQSASVGASLYASTQRRQMGLSVGFSAGNRADLSGNDAMQFFEDDDATRVVGISLESFGNPRKFSRIARRLSLNKPVVVTLGDVTGRRLPPGHNVRSTRAPAGAVEEMLSASGVMQVGNQDSMMDLLQVLATQPLPAGPRVGILANSATMAQMLADSAEMQGLTPTTIVGDLSLESGRLRSGQALATALRELFDDEEVDAVALCLQPTITGEHDDHSRIISETAQQSPKPMVMSLIGVMDTQVPLNQIGHAGPVLEDGALQQGVPIFSSPERSIRALGKIVRYQQWRTDGVGASYVPEGLETSAAARQADALLNSWLSGIVGPDQHQITREQTAQLLDLYGVKLKPAVRFDQVETAVKAAEDLGYPVVLKSTNPYLRHRLDLGAVELHVEDEDALRRRVVDMQHRLGAYGSTELEVQSMAQPGQGCLLRAIEDPLMGPVLSFGISGDAAELLDDWSHAVPPMTDQDLQRLVQTPKAARKLLGYRGVPGVDLDAVKDIIQRVAILKENHPQVAAMDLAPLLASPSGAEVLHAVVEIANPQQRTDSARRALN